MSLDPTQLATLATDITDNSGVGEDFEGLDPSFSDDAFEIARLYNLTASPDYTVWRTDITQDEINEVVDWSEVVAMTTTDLLSFALLKDQTKMNSSLSSIRQAFDEVFPTAQRPNTNAALLSLAKRLATRVEALLATGTGSGGSPGTMGFEGTISYHDVLASQ